MIAAAFLLARMMSGEPTAAIFCQDTPFSLPAVLSYDLTTRLLPVVLMSLMSVVQARQAGVSIIENLW